jgi:hypothetical protein
MIFQNVKGHIMKKLLSLVLFTVALHADSAEPTTPPPATDSSQPQPAAPAQQTESAAPMEQPPMEQTSPGENYGSFILNEVKLGYFRFGDKKLRHTYDKGVLDVQLTNSFCFWKPLYVYTSVEYIGADGRVHETHDKRKIRMVPVSLGVQYIQPITFDFKYYLTAGGRYFFVHQWENSTSLTHHGLGGFINTGFMYYLSEHIIVDFFGEYSYKRMHFHDMGGSLQVGGLTLGAGVGYFW